MISLIAILAPLLLQQPGGGEFMPTWKSQLSANGDRLLALDDIDGDGVPDWLHVDRLADKDFENQGSVTAFSGKTGALLWQFFGPQKDSRMDLDSGGIVDLEGDGRLELLFALPTTSTQQWPGGGLLIVLDSVTGLPLWQQGGSYWQEKFTKNFLAQDLNGDGILEILATSRGEYGLDSLSCFDAQGQLLWQTDLDFDGSTIHAVDLNGTGRPEILLGDPYRFGAIGTGKLTAIEAANGNILWEQWGVYPIEEFGRRLLLQDIDFDGAIDILTLGIRANVGGKPETGSVARISGFDGSELWRQRGDTVEARLGKVLQLADVNGNGVLDVVFGGSNAAKGKGQIRVVDGATGAVLWQKNGAPISGLGQALWVEDFQNTGSLQVLATQMLPSAVNDERTFNGWQLCDAATGQLIWERSASLTMWQDPDYQVADLNQDGILELVMSNPRTSGPGGASGQDFGVVSVIDGNGQILWTKRGGWDYQRYGDYVALADLNGDQTLEVLVHARGLAQGNSYGYGNLEARSGVSGGLIWQATGERFGQEFAKNLAIEDLNHDGLPELISRSPESEDWNGFRRGEMVVLNGSSGADLWRRSGNGSNWIFPQEVVIANDVDGDGWDELMILGNQEIQSMPGAGNFQPFMTASANSISAAAGGTIDLDLDFTPVAAWQEYRVIFSGHGVGLNYEFGLPIPLVLDHWLYLSMAGGLPQNYLYKGQGILDADGRGLSQLRFGPGDIPSRLVGLDLTFAVVARTPWLDWQYCSVPISINIQP
jgi:putative pyrroloquinoline-quinone binding quinoprotein